MADNDKILFLQHNTNTNQHNMHTCLEYDIENQIDYILFQKPWFAKDNITTISHFAYYCIVPEYQNIRSRVVIFARKQSRYQFCLRSDICSDSDLLVIDIIDKTKSFTETIQLINIYTEKSLLTNNNKKTIVYINKGSSNLIENPIYNNQYNFEKADWKIFAEELILQSNKKEFASNINISQISREMLETEAEKLRDIIIIAANKAISKKRIHEKSKPWWNEELKLLRKELAK